MDESEIPKLGSSLPVPCVQEVAKETRGTIPLRYQRPDQDPPFIFTNSNSNSQLLQVPVIDMSKLLDDDDVGELERLHHACKDWGFFQLTNHGVSSSLLDKVKKAIEEHFKMPVEEKKKFWQRPGDLEGFGQAFVFSEEQKLDWADIFFITMLPPNIRKPYLFPNLPLPFRDVIEAYSAEIKNVAWKIFSFQAKALGINGDDMRIFEGGRISLRMNYYPPCPQPELAIGLKTHSDPVGITILLQVNEMEGLQIRKDGAWIPIKPLPDAFVINVGDIMEVVTNGAYRSIEHRATVNSEKERISVAAFCSPKLDGEIGPAPSLITPETPPIFRTIAVTDYFKEVYKRKLEAKSSLEYMRIRK